MIFFGSAEGCTALSIVVSIMLDATHGGLGDDELEREILGELLAVEKKNGF